MLKDCGPSQVSIIREESEQVLELQGLAPRGAEAREALAEERAALQGLDSFQEAKGATSFLLRSHWTFLSLSRFGQNQ